MIGVITLINLLIITACFDFSTETESPSSEDTAIGIDTSTTQSTTTSSTTATQLTESTGTPPGDLSTTVSTANNVASTTTLVSTIQTTTERRENGSTSVYNETTSVPQQLRNSDVKATVIAITVSLSLIVLLCLCWIVARKYHR